VAGVVGDRTIADGLMAGVVDDDTVTEKMVKAGVGGVRTIKEGIVLAGVSMWV